MSTLVETNPYLWVEDWGNRIPLEEAFSSLSTGNLTIRKCQSHCPEPLWGWPVWGRASNSNHKFPHSKHGCLQWFPAAFHNHLEAQCHRSLPTAEQPCVKQAGGEIKPKQPLPSFCAPNTIFLMEIGTTDILKFRVLFRNIKASKDFHLEKVTFKQKGTEVSCDSANSGAR